MAYLWIIPCCRYYYHAACGLCQWEHPHVSFLVGVTARILREGFDLAF